MNTDENGYDYNYKNNGEADTKGWLWILLPIGIAIALYENGNRWKKEVFNYFTNYFQHPFRLFNIENMIFILLLFILVKGIIRIFKRRFI